jgi:hypothetical protein
MSAGGEFVCASSAAMRDAEAGRDSARDGGKPESRRKRGWRRGEAERKRARNGSVCAPGMRMGDGRDIDVATEALPLPWYLVCFIVNKI